MRAESTPSSADHSLPVVVDRIDSADGVCLHLDVPASLTWFDGHFPSDPILPGVAQIGWAITFARERFGLNADLTAIERVKFLRTAHPNERLMLELKREKTAVLWSFSTGGKPLSHGRLTFETA
ncbi:MAG: hydroxymyristoyl-ACP dehydratase [Gammaproteobacteria bacterium]